MDSRDKIKRVLDKRPVGLTIEDVAEICGLAYNTAYQSLRDLFHFQLVVKVEVGDKVLYRLAKHDISVHSGLEPRGRTR